VRTEDVVGRWGGDEFVVLLPSTGRDAAVVLAQRLRRAVATLAGEPPRVVPLTVSVGASSGVTQQLILTTRPLLTGRVLDPTGTALKGASLQPQLSTVTSAVALTSSASFTTDASGRFGLYVDPATYDVGITPPATAMLPRLWLPRQSVQTDLDLGDVQLSPAVTFDVVLRDAMQMPVQATVRLFEVPGADPDCTSADTGCSAAPQLEAEVATGSNGSAAMLLPAQSTPDLGSPIQ